MGVSLVKLKTGVNQVQLTVHALEREEQRICSAGTKAKLDFYDRRYTNRTALFQSEKFSRSLIKVEHSFGLQAYTVTPKGARILLEKCLPLQRRLIPFPGTAVVLDDTGIDCAMCAAYGSMQAFLCMPPLVILDDEQPSDRVATDQGSAGN